MATKARASSIRDSKPSKQRRLDSSPHARRPAFPIENVREAAIPRLSIQRMDLILVLSLVTAALILFLYRLDAPSVYEYDEIYHAFTANQYLLGNPEAFTYYTHPLPPAVMYTMT